MIAFMSLVAFIATLAAIPAWLTTRRKSRLFLADLAPPVLVPILWFQLASSGLGAQSLANLLEVPILEVIVIVLLYARAHSKTSVKHPAGASLILVVASLVLPLLSRLVAPAIPE